jgi:hypothetical protein
MKRLLIAALILFSSNAVAQQYEWIARAPNNAGGLIVLLETKGTCQYGLRMYSSNPNGRMLWGCWSGMETHILVLWDTGEDRISAFPYDGWQMNPKLPPSSPTPAGKPNTTF